MIIRRIIQSIDYRVIGPLTRRNARNWASKTDSQKTHRRAFKILKQSYSSDEAARKAVGGEFDAIGVLLRETLIHYGLRKEDYLIDVGCGSGRLAKPLSAFLNGKYLGIDVVPDLVVYARKLVNREEWRFELAQGLTIPESDQRADMVCFFSVFTHLLHEESFVYLQEAKRVLKSGGKIVASFLDFSVPSHWDSFENNLRDIGIGSQPMNVFMCPDMFREWARRLDLQIETIQAGDVAYVPLSEPITFENGSTATDRVPFGQSICVMVRR